MGVNIGLFETRANGDKIPDDTETRREHFLEAMSAGIAIVVPIQRVIEIITETPALIAGRDEVLRQRDKKSGFVPTSAKPVISSVEPVALADEEVAERRDAGLANALSTPPSPQSK